MTNWDEIPEALWVYVAHGVEFTVRSSSQWQGTAPFSVRDNKFYVSPKTGMWDEKQLGVSGNDVTFLGKMQEHYQEQMTEEALAAICKDRGLPADAFAPFKIGFDGVLYYIPVLSEKGTVRDLVRWTPKRSGVYVTKGRKPQLYGMEELAKAKTGSNVFICEGQWDRIALRWLFKKIKLDHCVVALPGAGVFKDEWVEKFKGFDCICMSDNDEAGDKMASKLREKFFGTGIKLQYLNWPETWESGYDIRDFIVYARKNSVRLSESWAKLESLVGDVHRRDDGTDAFSARGDEQADVFLEDDEAPTFDELVESYSKYLSMDQEMRITLLFVVSLIYSQQINTSEPLWAYVVAPAGGGKSVILSSMSGHRKTIYRSTITPNSLVSGFRSNADPSLLPKLNDKTFIIKDFTATLAGPDFMFEETMAILRDAYDGDFTKSYGNDVVRSYRGLHFSVIAGVTPMIHSKPQAMMGERFLKVCMRGVGFDEQLERLLATTRTGVADTEMQTTLQEAAARFLSRKVDVSAMPEIPSAFQIRLAGLAMLVAQLRASVQRDNRDPDRLVFRPEAETGNRPMRQLCKLAQSVRFVLRKDGFDDEVWRFIVRIALDSCIGFNIEVVNAIIDNGERTVGELAQDLRLSASTVQRTLLDLEALAVVSRKTSVQVTGGRRASTWSLSEPTARAIGLAGLKKKGRLVRLTGATF